MSTKDRQLLVLMNGRSVGTVRMNNSGRLEFRYDKEWRKSQWALPLSHSMPLTSAVHGNEVISAFMWGLLPDNEVTLREWGKRHHVSPNSCFALLGAVGADCPGAIQFAAPDKLDELQGRGEPQLLDDVEFEDIIVNLTKNPGAGRPVARETGQFSLAGAQPKTALYREGDRWAIPQGRTPTTHILKPAVGDLEGQVQNEHFCLRLAQLLDLPSIETELLTVDGTAVICAKRYDRQLNRQGQIVRVHQEDMCQALGIHPSRKYENEGGPGIVDIMDMLERVSSRADEDRTRFMRAQVFNFILAGTDAHAKNYSLILAPGKQARLAPLYDVASILPYSDRLQKLKLAMRISDKYRLSEIRPQHWERLADQANYPVEQTIEHIRHMLFELPGQSLLVYDEYQKTKLPSSTIDTLLDRLWRRCRELTRVYGIAENG